MARARRTLSLLFGLFFLALGLAGYVLPLLPGTVFVIVAAGFFTHSCPPFERWILNHTYLGPPVQRWRANGAISIKAKIAAIGSMAVMVVFTAARYGTDFPIVTACSVFFLSVSALYVGLCPED